MTVVVKNQRFAFLLWVLLLALVGSSVAQLPRRQRRPQPSQQQQQPGNSTAEQESEPNTANYPQRPVFTPYNPATQSPASANNQQTAPSVVTAQPAQPVNPAPQAPQAQANPGPAPQRQKFIGPLLPIPPTPEQMPPGAPRIAYQNGLLTVDSVNSRLTDILNTIHNRTGIQFEGLLPSQDRVAGKFGPAPADEVLTSLLAGSRYDYVIVGSPESPSLVQRVILTPSSSSAATAGVSPAPMGTNSQASDSEDEDNGNDEAEGQQPEQVQAPEPQQVPAVQPGLNPNGTPKTTEQLLEELKQIQQRNQQRQPPTAPLKPTVPQ